MAVVVVVVVDVVVAVVVVAGFSFGGIVSRFVVLVVSVVIVDAIVVVVAVVVKFDGERVVLNIFVVELFDVRLVVEIVSSSASSNPESVSSPNPESAPPALAAPLSPVPIPIVAMEAGVEEISSLSNNIIGVVTDTRPISPITAPKVIPIALFLLYLLLELLPKQISSVITLLLNYLGKY